VLPLIGAHWRAIAMDTAGFGDSEDGGVPASIEQWARVAAELLASLGIARAAVVGHHTGGVVAIELAAAFPDRVRALVLSSTPYVDEPFRLARSQRPPIDEVAPSSDGTHLAALWQKRQGFYPEGRPDLLEAFVRDALKVKQVEEGHRAVASYRMEDRIERVKQPALIIRATMDPFASPHAHELQHQLPQARIVDIDGGMVPLPDQMPEAFARVVLEFLATLG
jgi:pimeloyl-ACP methyl ester carboxylesterase